MRDLDAQPVGGWLDPFPHVCFSNRTTPPSCVTSDLCPSRAVRVSVLLRISSRSEPLTHLCAVPEHSLRLDRCVAAHRHGVDAGKWSHGPSSLTRLPLHHQLHHCCAIPRPMVVTVGDSELTSDASRDARGAQQASLQYCSGSVHLCLPAVNAAP